MSPTEMTVTDIVSAFTSALDGPWSEDHAGRLFDLGHELSDPQAGRGRFLDPATTPEAWRQAKDEALAAGIVPAVTALVSALRDRVSTGSTLDQSAADFKLLNKCYLMLGNGCFGHSGFAEAVYSEPRLIEVAVWVMEGGKGGAAAAGAVATATATDRRQEMGDAKAYCFYLAESASNYGDLATAAAWLEAVGEAALTVVTNDDAYPYAAVDRARLFISGLLKHADLREQLRCLGAEAPGEDGPLVKYHADWLTREKGGEELEAVALLVGNIEDHPALSRMPEQAIGDGRWGMHTALLAALYFTHWPHLPRIYPDLLRFIDALACLAVADSNKPALLKFNYHILLIKGLADHNDDARYTAAILKQIYAILGQLSFDQTALEQMRERKDGFLPRVKAIANGTEEMPEDTRNAAVALANRIDPPKRTKSPTEATPRAAAAPASADGTAAGTVPQPSSLFISYCWDDADVMRPLALALRAAGYEVWLDVEQMAGDMREKMADGIETADLIIVGISEKYKESVNCRNELSYGKDCNKPIVPIMAQDGYKANGWLAFSIAGILWYKCTAADQIATVLPNIVDALTREHNLPASGSVEDASAAAAEAASSAPASTTRAAMPAQASASGPPASVELLGKMDAIVESNTEIKTAIAYQTEAMVQSNAEIKDAMVQSNSEIKAEMAGINASLKTLVQLLSVRQAGQ